MRVGKLAHFFARHNDSRAAVPDSSSFAFFPQFLQWAGAGLKMGHGKDNPLQVFWNCKPALVIETSPA